MFSYQGHAHIQTSIEFNFSSAPLEAELSIPSLPNITLQLPSC
jgi:hypothetical protein